MSAMPLEQLLIGDSLPMVRLRSLIARIAPTSLPVLIEGPTGSGKELVARALHMLSGRRGQLVAFNVCAIADTMFEDALFGHVRGAFTGAVHDSQGFLAQANEGTAFFDEISGLPLGAQAKLLRAIESREFRPVGAKRDARSDFRVVAATNQRLEELQASGTFREDLRHRFGKMSIAVPPLCERREDIPRLVGAFIQGVGPVYSAISARALRVLTDYQWPGNVRELRAVIEAAVVMAPGRQIEVEDVVGLLEPDGRRRQVQLSFTLRRTLDVLRELNGDVTAAAKLLGVSRMTVYRRLRRAQISANELSSRADLQLNNTAVGAV